MASRSPAFRNGPEEIVEQESPLDYHGVQVRRLALVDPSAPPAPAGETYFAETQRLAKYGPTGRQLKKPRVERTPGAAPGVVAFADWSVTPDWLTIHYVTSRSDQRGRGHMTKLLDELIARHGHEANYINFGEVHSDSVWRYIEKLKRHREWDGKVRAKIRNPRPNMDESRRGLERRARSTGAPDDLLRHDVASERADGQARRVEELVRYAVWRVGEVMRPRDPGAWERAGGPVTSKAIAALILDAIRLDDAGKAKRAKTKKSGHRGSAITTSVAIEDFQQRRPCVEERHEEPCVYDGCRDCLDNCIDPEEGGGAPRYRQKVAAAFAFARDAEVALGIKATVTDQHGLISGPRSWVDSSSNPFEVVFGHQFEHWPLWVTLMGLTPSLAIWEEDLVDTDDVRVWDNGGRTADRFMILMQGQTPRDAEDGEPFHLTISSNRQPTNPQGIWMIDTDAAIDLDDTDVIGHELEPWQELLPRDVRDAIWDTRGRSIVRLPRELAERWARLTLGGHFD